MRCPARALRRVATALAFSMPAWNAFAAPPEQTVSAPVLIADPGVAYPSVALREHFYERVEVVLILEIDAAGNVSGASVERPGFPEFDQAAVEAAKRLLFEPAQRNSKPSAARIRYRYSFVPPPPVLVGRVLDARTGEPLVHPRVVVRTSDGRERALDVGADGSFSASDLMRGPAHLVVSSDGHEPQDVPVSLVPGEESSVVVRLESKRAEVEATRREVIEITVRGERAPPAATTYSRAEVRQIPGAFGDPFRAVETLPGVTPIASGLPFFYVRGAPPGNVGYFFDGIRVPYLFHVGIGPSVVQPALVERVDLYPGGYPARFGRFAGGIVAAEATEPRADFHGEGNLRVFDAGGLVEGGFAGGRGTALVGGRYSYTAAILSLTVPDLELDYRDYQARFSYDLTPRDRVTLFSFGSYDFVAEERQGVKAILFGTEFYRADLRYEHRWDTGTFGTAITLGYDQSNAAFLVDEPRAVVDRSIGARAHVQERLSSSALLRAGSDITLDAYSVDPSKYADPEDPEVRRFERVFTSRADVALGLWLDFVLNVTPGVELVPGLRTDLYRFSSSSAIGIDPRIAARFFVTPKVRIVHAYGIAHQPPSFFVPLSGLTPQQSSELQQSVQTSAGVELDLDDATLLTTTLFYNAFFDMTDSLGTTPGLGPPDYEARTQGSAVGAELFLRRRLTRRLGGFVSYTLSRSLRSMGRERFPSSFDRTHVANAAVAYDLGRGWRPGARFVFYTGTPTPAQSSGATAPPRTTEVERDSPYYRLDVRLEKRWKLGETAWVSFVAEVLNTTLNLETVAGEEVGRIVIPSLGVEAGF